MDGWIGKAGEGERERGKTQAGGRVKKRAERHADTFAGYLLRGKRWSSGAAGVDGQEGAERESERSSSRRGRRQPTRLQKNVFTSEGERKREAPRRGRESGFSVSETPTTTMTAAVARLMMMP